MWLSDSNISADRVVTRSFPLSHTASLYAVRYTAKPFFDKDRGISDTFWADGKLMVFKWAHGTPFTVANLPGPNLDGFAENRPVLLDASTLTQHFQSCHVTADAPADFRGPTSVDDMANVLGRNTFYIDGEDC